MSGSDERGETGAQEARQLLREADRIGVAATAGASWPYIAALLSLGASTSMGTLAMSVTAGTNYLVAVSAMMVWVMISISFMITYGRVSRIGFQKRWRGYMIAWTVAYAVAIALASSAQGRNLTGGLVGAGLILVVTAGGAALEARK